MVNIYNLSQFFFEQLMISRDFNLKINQKPLKTNLAVLEEGQKITHI